MSNRTGWVAPFVGLVFVAAYVAVAILLGEGQDATRKSADELVKYYGGHDTEQTIGALLIGVAAITLLFWAEQLRRVLRDAEGPTGILSAVAFAGRDRLRGRRNRRRHDPLCARRLLRQHRCRRSPGVPGAQRLRLVELPVLPGRAWDDAPGERDLCHSSRRASQVAGMGGDRARDRLPDAGLPGRPFRHRRLGARGEHRLAHASENTASRDAELDRCFGVDAGQQCRVATATDEHWARRHPHRDAPRPGGRRRTRLRSGRRRGCQRVSRQQSRLHSLSVPAIRRPLGATACTGPAAAHRLVASWAPTHCSRPNSNQARVPDAVGVTVTAQRTGGTACSPERDDSLAIPRWSYAEVGT